MKLTRLIISLLTLTLLFNIAGAQYFSDEVNATYTKILGIREIGEDEFQGVAADLIVEVRPGQGRVFVDTIPLTKIDTQASARLAKEVACTTLSIDCNELDVFYIIRSNHIIIGGPSAGSALTVATMAALQGKALNSNVMVTGTINPAGSIGNVGGVLEKAETAHEEGATIFLIPKGQEVIELENKTVNLLSFAREEFNLTVVLVEDVIDAYKYMTGFEIQRAEVDQSEVISDKLNNALMSLAESLLPQAREDLIKASSKINTTTLTDLEDIKELLEQSEKDLKSAESSILEGSYYSASSFAVRSNINSLYIEGLIDYYGSNATTIVEDRINKVKDQIEDFDVLFLQNKTIDSIDDVEVFAVVIERISDSERTVEEAYSAYEEENYETAIYLASYAEVRKNTAYQWMTLINEFKGEETYLFDQGLIRPLAIQRIEQSKDSLVYAQTVSGSLLLENARELLIGAEEAYNEEKYVFSLFEAAKARAIANLALEIRSVTNETIDSKVNQLEKDVLRAIQEAESKGLIPVLALSYYEFSKSFKETDPAQSLIYLGYSKEMAEISNEISESAFGDLFKMKQPVKTERFYEPVIKLDLNKEILLTVLTLFTGFLGGVLLILFHIERKEKKKRKIHI